MSEVSAAPAAAPATNTAAQPSAVQRASVDEKSSDDTLSTREAQDFLRQRREARKLKLVPKDEAEPETPAVETTIDTNAEIEANAEAEAEGDKPPEKEPTWAQKLRADLSKKTEETKALRAEREQRDAKFAEAYRQVQHRIEDAEADIKAEQTYSQMLEKAIEAAGFTVPADWKRAIAAERKAAALERQLQRGQSAQAKQGFEKSAEAAKQTITDVSKKIPEIAAGISGKDPEAQAWLRERFALDDNGKPTGLGLKNFERDAIAFAKALRWDRHSKAQAQKRPANPPPGEDKRPASTTLASTQGASTGGKRIPQVPQNEKESAAFLAARRAARK